MRSQVLCVYFKAGHCEKGQLLRTSLLVKLTFVQGANANSHTTGTSIAKSKRSTSTRMYGTRRRIRRKASSLLFELWDQLTMSRSDGELGRGQAEKGRQPELNEAKDDDGCELPDA